MRVGLISDTHGLLRPEALAALAGVERILHAGDVGDPEILVRLSRIAPVVAVRGNVDHGPGLDELPATAEVELAGHWVHVRHILADLDLDPRAAGFAAVLHGHTHRPAIERRAGVLFVNPGSAGPRRFTLPVGLAVMDVRTEGIEVELVTLEV